MKEYYIAVGTKRLGAFSIEDLKQQTINSNTLIWKAGWSDWKKASQIPELQALIQNEPPPIPQINSENKSKKQSITPNANSRYDYSKVEDIAGVDYKKAYIITGIFIALHFIVPSESFYWLFGFLLTFLFPIIIWHYFKLFFNSIGDIKTGKFVNYVMFSYAVYFLLVLLILVIIYNDIHKTSMLELIFELVISIIDPNHIPNLAETKIFLNFIKASLVLLFISFFLIWFGGIQLLRKQKNYAFPLKRIAWSTMFCLPISMITLLITERYMHGMTFLQVFLLLPYIFLFIHFYNADKYDATPN